MHQHRLHNIYEAFLTATLKRFGNYAFAHARKSGALVLEEKFTENEFNEYIRNYIRTRTGAKVAEVSKTTKKQIVRVIEQGRRENLTYSEIAKNIEDKTSGTIARSRAIMIARTEVHQASQDAQFEAIQETGLNVTKEWLAVMDARTREDHADANGQEANMEEPFIIGDEENGGEDEMMFPGDPDGPPNQVINCRCVCLYNSK